MYNSIYNVSRFRSALKKTGHNNNLLSNFKECQAIGDENIDSGYKEEHSVISFHRVLSDY